MKKQYILLSVLVISVATLAGFWGYRDIPIETLRGKYANKDSRFIQIQGMPVHVRVEGNSADAIPLLLLHGTGASLHTWDGWVSEMKSSKRIIRLDLPAFGLTGPSPDGKYSMDKFRSVLLEVLDSLGVGQVDIAGNSLGGYIAWYIALQNPERVRKLILIDAVGYPLAQSAKPIAFRLAGVPFLNKIFTYITPRFIVRNSIRDLYADKGKVSENLVDRYFELSLRPGNRQAFVDRSTSFSIDSSYTRIHSILQPTLILWGKEDHFVPESMALLFHNDLANDTLIVLPDNGHMPMEESPQITAAIALEFLSKR